jgi:hypothetical protein
MAVFNFSNLAKKHVSTLCLHDCISLTKIIVAKDKFWVGEGQYLFQNYLSNCLIVVKKLLYPIAPATYAG